ncbi:MAG: deoxyribose-phosphate aldolase [Candidatus Sericytochromatia bacterium]
MTSPAELAALVDHTLLKPEATAGDVHATVRDAVALHTYAVCVSPSMVPAAISARPPNGLIVAAVAGFPSGKHRSEVKAREAALAVEDGAAEIDMVIDIGAALAGDLNEVHDDIAIVRQSIPNAVLKVIVESAALLALRGESTLVDVCRVAETAGADFIKTSTGFHPSGGASIRAVELMADAVDGRLGVKASGGIRTGADALAMVAAGATRLGLSATRAVLADL